MKNKLILNKISRRILCVGLFFMTLAYLGILIYTRQAEACGMLVVSRVALMLEHVSMGVALVVVFALVLDMHIKKANE